MVAMSVEALKGSAMLGNIMIGGSFVAFLLSTILATVVFDEPGQNSTVTPQEIEMSMQVFPTEQHVKVWMDAGIPLHITADIMNISKILEDGTEESGAGLVDLFPVGEPATGKGVIVFKVASIDKTELPDLRNRTQETIPMAYIKEETFNPLVRSFLKFGAVNLNNLGVIVGLSVVGALGMIGAGGGLLFLDKKKTSVKPVEAPPPTLD